MRRPSFQLIALLAVVTARAEEVSYFAVPSGAGPHDVAPGPDGTVWYTAQQQGALGRLDPATGRVEQIPLGRDSAPHGVIMGPDGAAWVSDIVRFDPVAERFASFPSDRKSANVRQLLGRKGEVWDAESGTDRLVRVRRDGHGSAPAGARGSTRP